MFSATSWLKLITVTETLFHETQFGIELHAEIMHCAHNYQFSNLLAYN